MRRTRRPLAAAVAGLAAAALLTACSSVTGAVRAGQDAVSSAQGLVGAAADIGASCVAAQAALVPGISRSDARASIEEATVLLDDAIAATPDLPGVDAVKQALGDARASLESGGTLSPGTHDAISAACALAAMG